MPDKDEDGDDLATRILQLNARLKEEDEIVTVVLKAHLQVEQFVNQVLEELAVNPEPLSLYSGSSRFAQKLEWLQAFAPSPIDPARPEKAFWSLFGALNRLRNQIAHKPKGQIRDEALQNLRNKLSQFFGEDGISNKHEWSDHKVIVASTVVALRFFAKMFAAVQEQNKILGR
jgi:hypothetical protein